MAWQTQHATAASQNGWDLATPGAYRLLSVIKLRRLRLTTKIAARTTVCSVKPAQTAGWAAPTTSAMRQTLHAINLHQ